MAARIDHFKTGIAKSQGKDHSATISPIQTRLRNQYSRDPFSFHGQTSFLFLPWQIVELPS
jgi:hypothetical protein